jgi:hypothetical protein
MSQLLIAPSFLLWGSVLLMIINLKRFLQGKPLKFTQFEFTNFSYHLMMSTFIVDLVFAALVFDRINALFLFAFLAVTGILGETVFSIIWDTYFDKKFWEYKVSTIFNDYSSLLNFIPWGVGGFLYLTILNAISNVIGERMLSQALSLENFWQWDLLRMWLVYGAILLSITVFRIIFLGSLPKIEFKQVNLGNYIVFVFPFLAAIAYITATDGLHHILIFISFATIAFIAEYLFGKMCKLFVNKKLWTYTYLTFDHQHITPLAMIPFVMAGYWFWTMAEFFYFLQHLVVGFFDPYQFAYLIGALLVGVIWVFFYFSKKQLRPEMKFMSIAMAFTGLTEFVFFDRYWRPEFLIDLGIKVGIEDIILMFFTGGVAAVCYEYFIDDKTRQRIVRKNGKHKLTIILSICFGLVVAVFLEFITSLNIIFTLGLALYAMWLFFMVIRPDLLAPSVVNAFIVVVLLTLVGVFYVAIFPDVVERFWLMENLIGITFLGLPFEEYFWHFGLGLAVGPMYEVYRDIYYQNSS